MHKSQDIIGLPVLTVDMGKQIGNVRDLLFDRNQQLYGLLIENESWVKRARYIPAHRVIAYGLDAITVKSERVLESLEDDQNIVGIYSGKNKLKGLPVITTEGRELGRLENVYFLEEVGKMIGYELSDGLLNDWREGRKTLRTTTPLTWGTDALIVPSDALPVLTPVSLRK